MTEEEYFRKNYPDFCYGDKPLSPNWDFFQDGVEFGERQSEKRIEELEEKISVLLSCKNCPENKGGLLCQKEYEGKCLSQKIQFIKELQEENAELKEMYHESDEDNNKLRENIPKLAEAKEIIRELLKYIFTPEGFESISKETIKKAETFINKE